MGAEYGGLALERARLKTGGPKKRKLSRNKLWLDYLDLCEEFGVEAKSLDSINKWFVGVYDVPSLDFNLLASCLNEYLLTKDKLNLAGVRGFRL